MTVCRIYVIDDAVIVVWNGRGTTIDDPTYENAHAWFMQMRDSKVIDGTAFYDTISFNELRVQVTPAVG